MLQPTKKYVESPELQALYMKAAQVFSPSAPIDQVSLFAGRLEQLGNLLDTITTKGQHAVVYGERGVGKTSLVNIVSTINQGVRVVVVRHNCHHNDSFAKLWSRALGEVTFEVTKPVLGFTEDVKRTVMSLADNLRQADQTSPDEVVSILRRVPIPVVFVFDEFDQLQDKSIHQSFAEIIKALSDYAAAAKIILVGVGDTVDALISHHASIQRALRQVQMPRMKQAELEDFLDKALPKLDVEMTAPARQRIVRLAQGLPHYVHSIGLWSVRGALMRGDKNVDMEAVQFGVEKALGDASQSLLDAYLKATSSPQKDSLYRHVLLACALAKTDDLSYFAPGDIRAPLKEMGRTMEIPAFAAHLTKFAQTDRGEVLQRSGTTRRYRYRFRNPLLQPFVVMKGIADKLIDADKAEKLLAYSVHKK